MPQVWAPSSPVQTLRGRGALGCGCPCSPGAHPARPYPSSHRQWGLPVLLQRPLLLLQPQGQHCLPAPQSQHPKCCQHSILLPSPPRAACCPQRDTKGCSSGARWGSQPVPKVLAQHVPPQRDCLYQQFCQRCPLLMALLSVDLIYVTHSFTGIRGCDNKSSSLRRLRRSLFLRNVFSFTHQIFDK